MEKSIESLSVLFDKIYTAFILRDIAGKIIPGIILIIPIILIFMINDNNYLNIILSLNFGLWLFLVVALWIIGYIVQSFGELSGLVSYSLSLKKDNRISPNKYKWSPFITYYIVTLEGFLETQKNVYSKINKQENEDNLKYIERLAIIREACGNSGTSLVLSLPMYYYYFLKYTIDCSTIIFTTSILFVFITLLIRMHREHSYRYWYTLSSLINNID